MTISRCVAERIPPRSRDKQQSPAGGVQPRALFEGVEPEGALVGVQSRTLALVGQIGEPVERSLDVGAPEPGDLQVAGNVGPLRVHGQLFEQVVVEDVNQNVEYRVVHLS